VLGEGDARDVVAVLAASLAVTLSLHAAAGRDANVDASVTVGRVLGVVVAVVTAAVGVGAVDGALSLFVSAVFAAGAAAASLSAKRDARWLGLACAAAVGLLPAAGASSGIASALHRALVGPRVAVAVIVVVGVSVATLSCAHTLFGTYADHERAVRRRTDGSGAGSSAEEALAMLLASAAIASGVVLGVGTAPFGGRVTSLAGRMLEVDAPPSASKATIALAISAAAAATGFALASRPLPGWGRRLAAAPARAGSAITGSVARALELHVVGAACIDRHVLDRVAQATIGSSPATARIVAGIAIVLSMAVAVMLAGAGR
jgi:hypothetical protein